MVAQLFFLVLLVSCCVACFRPKQGVLLLLLIGFTQDSVRKLSPGEPIIFIVTVGFVFIALFLGFWLRSGTNTLAPFFKWTDKILLPIAMYVGILLMQLFHSLILYGNLVVAVIGLTTYIAPLVSLTVGYALINSIDDIKRILKFYILFGLVAAFTVMLSFLGYEWVILKEVGAGIKIYDQGTVLKSYAGIMRTGEIAAWHIAATSCLVISLFMSSKKKLELFPVLLLVLLLVVAVILTGRRKMLLMIFIFLGLYSITLLYYRRSLSKKYFFSAIFTFIAAWFGYELFSIADYNQNLGNYIARSTSVFSDATERFVQLGIQPIHWAYKRLGLFGGGLGIASQGGYMFGVSDVAGGSGEGGLGKIMVELGLPGLLIILWLGMTLAQYIDRCLKLAAKINHQKEILTLSVGFAAFLVVNAITFSVATQVYGDVFILILLGLFFGMLFAIPKVVSHSINHQSREILARRLDGNLQGVS